MPTAMSAKQIAEVAHRAGWRGEQLVIAVAVALAESSGKYWVVNHIGCVGLWQIYVKVHIKAHPTWTTAAMKDPDRNAAAAMVLYKQSGWKPWEAYTGPDGKGSDGPYTLQMGRARMAVAQIGKGGGESTTPVVNTGGGSGSVNQASWETISGNADQVLLQSLIPQLPSLVGPLFKFFQEGGGEALGSMNPMGPMITLGKAALSITVMIVRASAWIADPRNWLRVVEVIGGAAALFIGLKMLSSTSVGGPVAGAVRGGVKAAEKGVKAAKKVGTAAAAATPPGRAAAVASAATAKG
ncbi:hypothetical protein GCM10010387_67550 [Streptomyces inusitatus]|uniref:Transglycosylase SLT domain-containing protein n=1 Tax=Streptomyces inusitatus TaxID=68221 RepID=A0A918QR50_9ACTN|nr:hypothetical protein [Streptomyces inusitatus]GGZ64954.1 hypothetical protein GCM10010387_67550 [Streptomyces inusitatus]